MKFCKTLFSAPLAIVLSACSGGGDPSSPADGSGFAQVNSATVEGTSEPVLSSRQPIDSSENNGQFAVSYDISSSGSYTLSIVASKDNIAGTGDDIDLFEATCQDQVQCPEVSTIECMFDSSNVVQCGSASPVDLTAWFDELPQEAVIVVRAQTSNSDSGSGDDVVFR